MWPIDGYTQKDELALLAKGNANILLGALKGQTDLIRLGLSEGGDINALLDSRYGAKLFKMGHMWVDFPKWPAIHIAFAGGTRSHLNVAFMMLQKGADLNLYELPMRLPGYKSGYAPAPLYSLGLSGSFNPSESHAAMLQRLHESLPSKFNTTIISSWLEMTGNPPLIHIPAFIGHGPGITVLIQDMNVSIYSQDKNGVTALHIASWRGDLDTLALLLTNGADRFLSDKHNRTALHYAALRGFPEVVNILLIHPELMSRHASASEEDINKWKVEYVSMLDKDARSALGVVKMTPRRDYMIETFVANTGDVPWQNINTNTADMKRDIVHLGDRVECFEMESDDVPGRRGGWDFPEYLQCSNDDDDLLSSMVDSTQIDIISASEVKKGIFRRDYFIVQRPLLISKTLFMESAIWAHYRREDFLNRYGDVMVTIDDFTQNDNRVLLKVYVESHMSRGSTAKQYPVCSNEDEYGNSDCIDNKNIHGAYANYASEDFSFLKDDLKQSSLFKQCPPHDDEALKIEIGPTLSKMKTKQHNASWSLLVTGVKKWYISPPLGITNVQSQQVKEDQLPVFSILQYPGDVVFLPHNWRYSSVHLADSISISQEFCTLWHTDQRCQPLGDIIYGGTDEHRGKGNTARKYPKLFRETKKMEELTAKKSRLPQFDTPYLGDSLE